MGGMYRALRPDEVECRVGQVSKTGKGCSMLLYKDARCDMRALDEAHGPFGWQRKFSRDEKGVLKCSVGIRDPETGEWVWKEDAGTPSDMESEKGEYSDAFKRACFAWGIGRELYTAPFIWIKAEDAKIEQRGSRYVPTEHFRVSEMDVEDGRIVALTISTAAGRDVFKWAIHRKPAPKVASDHLQPVRDLIKPYAAARQLAMVDACAEVAEWAGVEDMRDLTADMVGEVVEMMRGVIAQV